MTFRLTTTDGDTKLFESAVAVFDYVVRRAAGREDDEPVPDLLDEMGEEGLRDGR